MIKHFDHAELLYQILPSIYRERDASRDLQKYLNGCGLLLDQLHRTLLQRYADIFPDSDTVFELDSQSWLLPYIAALLDVRLTSPLESGRREEIANAISWRKAKGTLRVVDELERILLEGDTGFTPAAFFQVKENLTEARRELRQQIDLAHRRWR